MGEEKSTIILATVEKLFKRKAFHNIEKIFRKTHSADIAAILSRFPAQDSFLLFDLEKQIKKKSEILSHLSEDQQKKILELIDQTELAKLVQHMDSDDAADVMNLLEEEEAQALLENMKPKTSEAISDLMGYPEDSAGSVMSFDFFSLSEDLTVSDAIQAIQQDNGKSVIFYIYIINENKQLTGVLSLKQLILCSKNLKLKEIMLSDVVVARINESPEEVARRVERYDFLSLPVVNEANKLLGIVTVDDIIDIVREEAEEDLLSMGQAGQDLHDSLWKHFIGRFPWLLFAYCIGSLCFAIIYSFKDFFENEKLLSLTSFIPIILTMGATAGGQTTTMGIAWLRSEGAYFSKLKSFFKTELKLSVVFAILFSLLNLSFLLIASQSFSFLFSLSLFFHILLSMLIATFLPYFVGRLGGNITLSTSPVFTALSDLSALLILFFSFYFVYQF